jgi:hypothetical protein
MMATGAPSFWTDMTPGIEIGEPTFNNTINIDIGDPVFITPTVGLGEPVNTRMYKYVTLIRQDTLESLEIDVSSSVDLNYGWSVTSHPVERGAEISDHTQPLPAEIQINGIITGFDLKRAGTTGTAGPNKFSTFKQWMLSASTTLWTVVIPRRPSLANCLVTTFRVAMTMDNFLTVTIGVREIRLVNSRTTAPIYAVSTGSGGGVGRNPSASTAAELAPEAQDGVQEPRAGFLWNTGKSIMSAGRALNPF